MHYRVNWLIHNFLQRDPTTRSLHVQPSDLSSTGSLHVESNNDRTSNQNESEPLQRVLECFHEETRCSSRVTLEPLDESLIDVRRSSRSSLSVPRNLGSTRRLSVDDVEEVIASPPRSEIRIEVPQAGDVDKINATPADTEDNTTQASASDIHYSSSSPKDERKTNAIVDALVTSSLSPSLGAVHIMRPLAGVAWTKDSTNARAKSRSLRSFLRPKMQHKEVGSQSAPSSPASSRSAQF